MRKMCLLPEENQIGNKLSSVMQKAKLMIELCCSTYHQTITYDLQEKMSFTLNVFII